VQLTFQFRAAAAILRLAARRAPRHCRSTGGKALARRRPPRFLSPARRARRNPAVGTPTPVSRGHVKASVFIATSLDGFIARPDGALDWLPGFSDGEDYGYAAFISTVGALVMGRASYETVLSFGTWPYGDMPVVVLSSAPVPIDPALAGRVEWMAAPPAEVVRRLGERGVEHIYVDGGKTIQRFLADGRIQEMIITRVPVLLGDGIPLFGALPGDVLLRHLETRVYPDGLVQSRYEVLPRE
jgi:dihydrofolate reductase